MQRFCLLLSSAISPCSSKREHYRRYHHSCVAIIENGPSVIKISPHRYCIPLNNVWCIVPLCNLLPVFECQQRHHKTNRLLDLQLFIWVIMSIQVIILGEKKSSLSGKSTSFTIPGYSTCF